MFANRSHVTLGHVSDQIDWNGPNNWTISHSEWLLSQNRLMHLKIHKFFHKGSMIFRCISISLTSISSWNPHTLCVTSWLNQGFWIHLYFRIRHSFAHAWTILNKMASFWHHCACVDNFKQNGVFWRQHLPTVRVWTWPKYNKHHHDLKNQLCRFIDIYIVKIFWPTAPCRGCPEKEIWGQG